MPSASKNELICAAAGGALGATLLIQALSFCKAQQQKGKKAAAAKKEEGKKASTTAAAAADEEISTTSSSHSGNVYETDKAVAEYLMFHFGDAKDLLPYACGPHNALDFASRTAAVCGKWAAQLGLPMESGALDIGCAVGRTSFDLSKDFGRVVGIDFSHAFVNAANALKQTGSAQYTMTVEGDITSTHTALLPAGINADRVIFQQGDACNLPQDLGKFAVVHAANLLCRLPDPKAFLDRLPSLLVPGGIFISVSPYSWLKQYTPREKWLGGKKAEEEGKERRSFDGLAAIMTALGFEMVHQEECPFLIREHARKFQWGCSDLTIWQLKAPSQQ